MTTKYKVIIGFLLMTCLLIAVAALGYVKLKEASKGFVAYRVESRTSVAANGADALMREVQGQLSRFRLDLDQAHIQQASVLIDRTLNYYLANAKKAETNPQEIALLDRQVALVNQVNQLMHGMQQKLTSAGKLIDGPLKVLTRGLNDTLSEMSAIASQTNNTALLVPIDEAYSNYVEARDQVRHFTDVFLESAANEADKYLAGLGAALKGIEKAATTEETKSSSVKLNQQYADYTIGFKNVKATLEEALAAYRQIDALGNELVKNFDGYTSRAEHNMDIIGEAVQASNVQAETLIVASGAAGIGVGVLFSFFIILGLMKVLKELGAFANAVAHGDFTYPIKIREKGEIGAMIQNMRLIPEVLSNVMTQGRTLANDIAIGNFRARFDLKKFDGSFAELTACINSVGDAYTSGAGRHAYRHNERGWQVFAALPEYSRAAGAWRQCDWKNLR